MKPNPTNSLCRIQTIEKRTRWKSMRRSVIGAGTAALCALNLSSPQLAQAGYVTACNSWDWNHWNNAYPWGNTHNGSAYMSSNNVSLQGGWMQLHAHRGGAPSGYNFYSGTVYCKTQIVVDDAHLNWTISGSFEADPESGSWPAMWLDGAWTWPPEIDIMEFKGNSNCWQNTYQLNGAVNSHINGVSNPYGSWHTYKAWINRQDATNVTIDYYIDGNWKARDTAAFTGKPMNLIVDLQTEGSSGTAWFNDSYLTSNGIEVGYTAPDYVGPNDGTYKVINQNSGKAMDAYNQGTSNGTQIIQWGYWGGNGQKWTVTNTGNGYAKIIGVQSGKSLDVYNGGSGNGTKVELWDYWNNAGQQWKFVDVGGGYSRVYPNCATGSCLDVNGVSTADGALVQIWQYLGNGGQKWAFQTP